MKVCLSEMCFWKYKVKQLHRILLLPFLSPPPPTSNEPKEDGGTILLGIGLWDFGDLKFSPAAGGGGEKKLLKIFF